MCDRFNNDSFARIYESTCSVLIGIAYGITGNMAVSEEICQEAYIKYISRRAPLPSLTETRYWLIRVVKNLCFNHEKRKNRELRANAQFAKLPIRGEEPAVEENFLRQESKEQVRRLIKQLPVKLRQALVLREFGDLSYREIGKIMRLSEGNVKVRVWRARERLQILFAKEEENDVP